MIDKESKVRRGDQVVARELTPGEGGVLLHLESAQYFGLNQIGLLIWNALEEEKTAGELVDHVRSQVEDPPAQLESDVLSFLAGAQDRGIVDLA